jgi:hypothetical protein
MPFNPITLEYEKSQDGDMLRQKDDTSKVRAFVRAQNLDSRANTNYNVISGNLFLFFIGQIVIILYKFFYIIR